MGFNNRTCSPATSSSLTAGPVMRGGSTTMLWREWLVDVTKNSDTEDTASISIQAFASPDVDGKAKCLGFVSNFYGLSEYPWTCALSKYSGALFLNGTKDTSNRSNPQKWTVIPHSTEEGAFELVASNKPRACLRVLAVEGCESQPTLIEQDSMNVSYTTSWKFVKRYELLPPPPPHPSPPPPPSPLGATAGPVISGPSSTLDGYIRVLVKSLGGGNQCPVTSILLTWTGSSIDSKTIEKEVPASTPGLDTQGVLIGFENLGYHAIYAYGKCSGGDLTERSNGLSVFNANRKAPERNTVLFSLRYGGLDVFCFDDLDESQVCKNVLQLQEGGVCKILSALPGSVVVTGTVKYPNSTFATKLVQQLDSSSSSTILLSGNWTSGSPTNVTTEYAASFAVPASLPSPPSDVTMEPYNAGCPSAPGLDVSFKPPIDLSGIVAYTATCYPAFSRRRRLSSVPLAQTVVEPGTNINSITVSPLTQGETYLCKVQSLSANAASTEVVSQSSVIAGCGPPGAPQSLTSIESLENITVSWIDGYLGNVSDTTFEVKCVDYVSNNASLCSDQASGVSDTGISPGTQTGTVTLLSNYTEYECFVIATNSFGSACSDGISATTLGPPRNASISSVLSVGASFDVTFTNSLPGNPVGQSTVLAVAKGGSCSDTPVVNTTGLAFNSTTTTLNLPSLNTTYSVYVAPYNEYGSSCSDQVQNTTEPFGMSVGVATHPTTGMLYAANLDLPVISQCQYSGTQLSDCGNGYPIFGGAAMGINGNTLYTSAIGGNITACDLTSNVCNSTIVSEISDLGIGVAFANNSMYLTTFSLEIAICEIDGLQIGPCRAQNLTGADNSTFAGDETIAGITVNETSGVFYFSSFPLSSPVGNVYSCDLNLSSCMSANITSLGLVTSSILAVENKVMISVVDFTLGGGLLICDQSGQGIDVNSCALSGNQTNLVPVLAFGMSYAEGNIFLSAALFLRQFGACTVDLTTNLASNCQSYLGPPENLFASQQGITSISSPMTMISDILNELEQKFRFQ